VALRGDDLANAVHRENVLSHSGESAGEDGGRIIPITAHGTTSVRRRRR